MLVSIIINYKIIVNINTNNFNYYYKFKMCSMASKKYAHLHEEFFSKWKVTLIVLHIVQVL